MSAVSDILPGPQPGGPDPALPPVAVGGGGPPNHLTSAAGGPQVPVERLKRRMDGYRELHNTKLPKYNHTANQINLQQIKDTKLLRQKFLESKTKKTSKKSSNAEKAAAKSEINNINSGNFLTYFLT